MSQRQFSEAPIRPVAGVYLVHKPEGATSFSVVKAFMERLAAAPGKRLKVCHGGALDPFASGLLPVLVGPTTRLFELLHQAPKRYLATLAWGAETDSLDGLGTVTRRADQPADQPKLEAALRSLIGWADQVPPAMSNKRVGGERAYAVARRGEAVDLPAQRVYLHAARFLEHQLPARSTVELVCRGGFYVRALARDVGRAAGCLGHVSALRRVAIGPWEDAPEERRVAQPSLLPWLPQRLLSDEERGLIRRGAPIPHRAVQAPVWPLPEGFAPTPFIAAVHQSALVAVLEPEGGQLCARVLVER